MTVKVRLALLAVAGVCLAATTAPAVHAVAPDFGATTSVEPSKGGAKKKKPKQRARPSGAVQPPAPQAVNCETIDPSPLFPSLLPCR